MKKGLKGRVLGVRPELKDERLKVIATVKMDGGEVLDAHMPDREISAVLPRSILLGPAKSAPLSLLATVEPILARMTEGREVRVWQYKDRWFFSFQPWKGVRFVADEDRGAVDRRKRSSGGRVQRQSTTPAS